MAYRSIEIVIVSGEKIKMQTLLIVAFAGIIAQLVDGTLGMGYGVTSSTLLTSFGIYPVIVSASVHMSELATTFGSGLSHWKFGNVEKKVLLPLVIFGCIGGVAGAVCLATLSLSGGPVKKTVSIILLAMGCLICTRFLFAKKAKTMVYTETIGFWKLAGLGLVGAFVDATGGGGWGPVVTTSLVVADLEPRKAIGSVDLSEFFVTLAMVITFIFMIGIDQFRWDIAVVLALAALPVTPLAAWLCKRIPHRFLGIAVGILLILINIRALVK